MRQSVAGRAIFCRLLSAWVSRSAKVAPQVGQDGAPITCAPPLRRSVASISVCPPGDSPHASGLAPRLSGQTRIRPARQQQLHHVRQPVPRRPPQAASTGTPRPRH